MDAAKNAALVAVRDRGLAIRGLAVGLQVDQDVILAAVEQNGDVLEYTYNTLIITYPYLLIRQIVLAAVEQKGDSIRFLGPELREDREIVLAAVKKNGNSIRYLSPELRADREVVLAAVSGGNNARGENNALGYALGGLQMDQDVILVAVRKNGDALEYGDPESLNWEIILAAVEQNGDSIRHLSNEMRWATRRMLQQRDAMLAARWGME
jgi:lambda repressor-like predicted transcriptional regulator